MREICAWDPECFRRIEAWAHHTEAPAPTAGRSVFLRIGSKRAGRTLWLTSFLKWLERADLLVRGHGLVYPYNNCSTCHGVGLTVVSKEHLEACVQCPDCGGASWNESSVEKANGRR
jgi:hypothetical protein